MWRLWSLAWGLVDHLHLLIPTWLDRLGADWILDGLSDLFGDAYLKGYWTGREVALLTVSEDGGAEPTGYPPYRVIAPLTATTVLVAVPRWNKTLDAQISLLEIPTELIVPFRFDYSEAEMEKADRAMRKYLEYIESREGLARLRNLFQVWEVRTLEGE